MDKKSNPDVMELAARDVIDTAAQLVAALSCSSEIGLVVFDKQHRFQVVNNVVAAMHHGIPAEVLVGKTMRDIIGEAALQPEARLQDLLRAGETPSTEVSVMLPTRTEPGYWIEKNFTIKDGAGRVMQIGSLGVEVTPQRKLEGHFRRLAGDLLRRNEYYQQLARELHDSIRGYHAAVGMSLDHLSRCTRDPERIPELLAQSMDFLDKPMRKLASAIARCFPIEQH